MPFLAIKNLQKRKLWAEAPSLYIEWYGDNEVANEMVTRGMGHVMNVEFDKAFVFFEAATQLDSTLFGPHVMLAQFSNANSENQEFHYARAKVLAADKNVNSKLFVSLLDEKNEKGKRQVLGADNHLIWKKMYENEPRGRIHEVLVHFWDDSGRRSRRCVTQNVGRFQK